MNYIKNKYVLFFVLLFTISACASKKYDTVNNAEEASKINNNVNTESVISDNSIKISDKVFFDFDKSNINQESKVTLDLMFKYLKKYPNINLLIEGHTDERGTREYNIALGQRRAASVKNYLVSKGINASRVKIISYGKEKPEYIGSSESVWSKNRRAVSVIIETKKNK